jgi:hypothetical protein
MVSLSDFPFVLGKLVLSDAINKSILLLELISRLPTRWSIGW